MGRKRKYADDFDRKIAHKNFQRDRDATRVCLGATFEEWRTCRENLNMKSDEDLARLP